MRVGVVSGLCRIENIGVLNSKVLVELDVPILCVLLFLPAFVPNALDNLEFQ